MTDITSTITAIRKMAADAGHLAGDLEQLMKLEADHARRGVLHRVAMACRELSLHANQGLARLAEVTRQGASRTLGQIADELKQVLSEASPGPNHVTLDTAIGTVRKARSAIGKM